MEVANEKPPFELKAQSSFEDSFRKLWNGFDMCGHKAAKVGRGAKTPRIPAGGAVPVNNDANPSGVTDHATTCNESHTTTSSDSSSSLHDETSCNNPSLERDGEESVNDTTIDTDKASPTRKNQSRSLEISDKESDPSNNEEMEVTQQGEKVESASVEYPYNVMENKTGGWMTSVVVTIMVLLMALLGASLPKLDGNIPLLDFKNIIEGVRHQIEEVLTARLLAESTRGLLNKNVIQELVEESIATNIDQQPNKGGIIILSSESESESDLAGDAEKVTAFSKIEQKVTDNCFENAGDTATVESTGETRDEVETAKAKVLEGEMEPMATSKPTDATRKDNIDPSTRVVKKQESTTTSVPDEL
jgi:hypothetical protein